MGQCIALTDSEVHELLINLSQSATLETLRAIERCLQSFSLSEERKYQPGVGVVNRPTGQKTLFRPFTSATSVGTKIIVDPAPDSNGSRAGLHGILALCDNRGNPTGILNAEEITGYRTSLSAAIPFMWRRDVRNIVVFGAGKQALWHIRLALMLRGSEAETILVVNRSQARGQSLVEQVEEENRRYWKSEARLMCISPANPDYEENLAGALAESDVIFCTVPSQSILFPARLVINREQRQRLPLITAIGSWQPDMMELDPALLRHVVDDKGAYHPTSEEAGGAIIVDDRPGCFEHAGEIVHSKVEEKSLIELGEMIGLRNGERVSPKQRDQQEVREWLAEGLVIYKSIGVSVTDLAAAEVILALAQQRGVGTALVNL